ncbi:MAG: hypothetical protein RL322_771 [Pseudomonadota bacterium]|jgi:putative FmdB family regulatory protein
MPIYAYRCPDCGFEKDQLQKISDPPLTECPSCGGQGFAKILTAPAFQLKGSGWYVTDFRDQGKGRTGGDAAASGAGGDAPASESAKSDGAAAPSASAPAAAATGTAAAAPAASPKPGSSAA